MFTHQEPNLHADKKISIVLGCAPGGMCSIERAPFKLTTEMVNVIGGRSSSNFQYFVKIITEGAITLRRNAETVLTLVEVMSYQSTLPCFEGNLDYIISSLRDRLFLNVSEEALPARIETMVESAYNHYLTTTYDQFQVMTNGIAR